MKKPFLFLLLALSVFLLPGCEVVSGIFKAGMYWAFFLVALVVVLILWIVMKGRKK